MAEKIRSRQEVRKERAYSAKQFADHKLIFVLDFNTLHGFVS